MQQINASSLARAVPWALDQVKDGDTVTVTRGKVDGWPKPVAVLVSLEFYSQAMDAIMGEPAALDAPVGNIPDVETLERISTLLEGSIVMTDAMCIENHRAGFPLRTLCAGEQCGWGRKRGCHCGDGFVEPDEAEIDEV